MMMLQSQVTLLDRFVIQQESIPNMLPPLGARHVPLQYVNRGPDVTNNIGKNVWASNIFRLLLLLLFTIIKSTIVVVVVVFSESKRAVSLKIGIARHTNAERK